MLDQVLIEELLMMSLSFLFGRHEPVGLFGRSRRCVLTALTTTGRPHTCKVRVAACSDDRSRLWFVMPRNSGVIPHIARDGNVMLSVMDPDSMELVHMGGTAVLMQGVHRPVYLAEGFQQSRTLQVTPGEIYITLVKVTLKHAVAGDEVSAADLAEDDSEAPHSAFRFTGPQGNPSWLPAAITARLGSLSPARRSA